MESLITPFYDLPLFKKKARNNYRNLNMENMFSFHKKLKKGGLFANELFSPFITNEILEKTI